MSLFRFVCCWLVCSLAQAQTPPPASTPNSAGVVTLAEGGARLSHAGGAPQTAKVGDVVSEGDVLTTSKTGELHMVMQDTGFMALRPNSQLVVVNYKDDGGDDDKGVFKLLTGGLRSITGWIGRFNAPAYQVRTPTATVGIRGTDHETRVIPEGSDEGEPGTYDKVFAGQTFIETADGGATAVAPDQAGFASAKPKDKPRLLAQIPGFFRPGPHEADIAKKHAEIQGLIDQRRNERRKVIVEKMKALAEARQHIKADMVLAQEARQQAGQTAQAEHQEVVAQREAMQREAQSLKERLVALKAQREELQALAKSGQATAPELRRRRKALVEDYAALERAQADLEAKYKALRDSVEAKVDGQFQANQERRQSLHDEHLGVREKRKELEAERASAREEIGGLQRQENQRVRGDRKADRTPDGVAPIADKPQAAASQ